jgi:hypothetical protein
VVVGAPPREIDKKQEMKVGRTRFADSRMSMNVYRAARSGAGRCVKASDLVSWHASSSTSKSQRPPTQRGFVVEVNDTHR